MRRREFISLLGIVASCPFADCAQGAKVPRIGVLSPSRSEDASPNRVTLKAFVAGLRELGYVKISQSSANFQMRMPIDFVKPPLN